MNFKELKAKTPADLLAYAEELNIENPSTLRKQDIFFAILNPINCSCAPQMIIEHLKNHPVTF